MPNVKVKEFKAENKEAIKEMKELKEGLQKRVTLPMVLAEVQELKDIVKNQKQVIVEKEVPLNKEVKASNIVTDVIYTNPTTSTGDGVSKHTKRTTLNI